MIDYRSDTFTKPTKEMYDAMCSAELGDDVFGEDPSVNLLEEKCANLFGKEAALFCPSGTMTNQIAIKCHTSPGDEVICDQFSHVYIYEGGGIAFNSGCQVRPIQGDRGRVTAEQIALMINAEDIHKPISRLVCLENTSNRGGGACYDLAEILAIRQLCIKHGLALHLDGARIWNAMVAKNESPKKYGELFDSLSVCLSKGLGAPVGSVLIGEKDFILKARRIRKVFGGGMRQAGILAAAGSYALDHHIERLKTDHLHAKQLEKVLSEMEFVTQIIPVETNILIFTVEGRYSPVSFVAALASKDIKCMAISPTQVRMVTHLDIHEEMILQTIEAIRNLSF